MNGIMDRKVDNTMEMKEPQDRKEVDNTMEMKEPQLICFYCGEPLDKNGFCPND